MASQTTDVIVRTLIGKEFSLSNRQGQFNCFLNVVLQYMWNLPDFREWLILFSDSRDRSGPNFLNPFIDALREFFFNVHQQGQLAQGQTFETNCDKLRVELFKLNYLKGEFVLNEKADAFEALSFILDCISTWLQFSEKSKFLDQDTQNEISQARDEATKLDKLSEAL